MSCEGECVPGWSPEVPSVENPTGLLHSEAIRGMLTASQELKKEIPVQGVYL